MSRLIKTISKMSFFAVIFSFSIFAVALSFQTEVSAAEDSTSAQDSNSYTYTAVRGDSYTKLARASILEYDKSNDDVSLSAAEVTAAETFLTQDSGSPYLEVNQAVEISKDKVAQFVNQATALSDSAKQAWQRYANQSDVINTVEQQASASNDNEQSETDKEAANNEQQNPATEGDDTTEENAEKPDPATDGNDDNQDDSATEDSEDTSSRRWLIIAVIVLLILAAITLIRSSGKEE